MKSLRQRAPRVGLPQGRMGSEEAWQVAQMEKSYSRKKVSLGGGEGNVRRYIGRTVVDTGGIVG